MNIERNTPPKVATRLPTDTWSSRPAPSRLLNGVPPSSEFSVSLECIRSLGKQNDAFPLYSVIIQGLTREINIGLEESDGKKGATFLSIQTLFGRRRTTAIGIANSWTCSVASRCNGVNYPANIKVQNGGWSMHCTAYLQTTPSSDGGKVGRNKMTSYEPAVSL
ncbi:uncharacterized protein ARMOST_11849 [Armillaria ostoyae]|uniref:Uncharacterized protein n=1 Tax=Armillaria ostoyae TaxID=47428 RepID=A0A284RI98_ARMOS|nr:uncharacterized protein ARMOST_11849 [Armillaria ostoyae]